jgi:hypothetical protein
VTLDVEEEEENDDQTMKDIEQEIECAAPIS